MTVMLERQVETTESVIAGMLVENTGRHMLDSGGAYGRSWERNQGRDFASEVPVRFDGFGTGEDSDIWVVINIYHYLVDRLEFDPIMDRAFNINVADRDEPDDPWLVEAEEFAQAWTDDRYSVRTRNSYNDESSLSQVIQYVEFKRDMETYIVLQIHGGCDVRGGYTKPRVFKAESDLALLIEDVSAGHKAAPVVGEQLTIDGGSVEVRAIECPLGEYAINYRSGETLVYRYDQGYDIYDTDEVRKYLPVRNEDGEVVCRGCEQPMWIELDEHYA